MTDFSRTLIRCHALGQIMTEIRGKTNLERHQDAVNDLQIEVEKYAAMPNKSLKSANNKLEKIKKCEIEVKELELIKDETTLSDTCKTYLIQSYVLSKYGRVREISTKQMVKGTMTEEECIKLFSIVDGIIYNKNSQVIRNSFICGTPDLFSGENILQSGEIIDIKSCWDIFTFLSNVSSPENANYYWQVQGYMALTGAKIGTVAYCLVNTPDSIVEGEKYNLLRRMDVATEEDPSFKKEFSLLRANRIFDDLPFEDRVLTYSIERNDQDIENIYRKVEKCREFLSEFEAQHKMFSKDHRKTLFLQSNIQ